MKNAEIREIATKELEERLETTIIPGVQERVSDWAFAISAFADFPVSNASGTARYGAAVDREPFTKDNPW